MGERVEKAWLRDGWRVRRDGRWLLHDTVRMDGPISALLRRPAVAAGARAVATLLLVAPDAAAFLTPVREALEENGAETGVSAWNGMLVARMLASDSARLRQAVAVALNVIRAPRPLPRVWMC